MGHLLEEVSAPYSRRYCLKSGFMDYLKYQLLYVQQGAGNSESTLKA